MCRQTKRQLPTSRMPYNNHPLRIELILTRILNQKLISRPDIGKRSRPSPTQIPHPPVFQICRSRSLSRQRRAKMPNIPQVISRPPIPAMNHHSQRMWSFTLRQTQIHKLILIATISNANISPRRNPI